MFFLRGCSCASRIRVGGRRPALRPRSCTCALPSGDDLRLLRRREIHEVRGVAGDAHDQVPVLLRVLLRRQQRFPVEDVELDVPVLQVAPGADDLHQPPGAFFAGDVGRAELQVDQVAPLLPIAQVPGPGHEAERHRGPLDVHAVGG